MDCPVDIPWDVTAGALFFHLDGAEHKGRIPVDEILPPDAVQLGHDPKNAGRQTGHTVEQIDREPWHDLDAHNNGLALRVVYAELPVPACIVPGEAYL